MNKYKIFNNIAEDGLSILSDHQFEEVAENPDGLLLRSHKLTEKEFGKNLSCIARAGAGTNNIPIEDATKKGIVVFNTPGANANAVKELVICGMLLSSRGIVEGINFAQNLDLDDTEALNKAMESQKKTFAGNELAGKTLGIVGLGAIALAGLVFFSHQVGSFAGAWLGGRIFDIYQSYVPMWWAAVVFGVLAALIHMPIQEDQEPKLA